MAKMRIAILIGIMFSLQFTAQPTRADDKKSPKALDLPIVRLGKVASVDLGPRPAMTPDRAKQIKALIASLAEIDRPDFGLSATMSGTSFAPIAGHERAGAFLLTDHQIKPASALRKLVEMGPEALPYLLDALDNQTATKLTMKHESFFGAMWFADEMWGNPVNALEQQILKTRKPAREFGKEEMTKSYTLKVGDVCFVAIGQITGRQYRAVRYQPTACVVLNSPTQDADLCARVRAIWKSKNHAKKLLDSLLTDYATEGIYVGKSLDGWYVGSNLQIEAVVRLLYYFPKETTPHIAPRLKSLDVRRTGPGTGSQASPEEYLRWKDREVRNGVRTDEIVKAVSWCKEPAIREAVMSIFKRTEDPDILLAALAALEKYDSELVRARLEPIIDKLPADEGGAYGDGYNLLLAMIQRDSQGVKPVFQRYLRNAEPQRCYTVCEILGRSNPTWSNELLEPFLNDRRPVRGYSQQGLAIRVCDAAARSLIRIHPRMKFEMVGEYEDRDRRIHAIQKQLAAERQGKSAK